MLQKFNSLFFALLLSISLLPALAEAKIIFEGYYKVTQFKKHIGFLILRHELDDKTNNFRTTAFTKLGKEGFDMTESYKVESTTDLTPVSLSYLAVEKKKTKMIEAKIKDLKMTGTVVESGKKIKLDTNIPKGSFFSSALYYLMLQSKDGLKQGTKFDYIAVSEEGPVAMNGTVTVDAQLVSVGTQQVLKINNLYAGSDYDNLVTLKGEVVATNTPGNQIESQLVKDPADAIAGIKISKGSLEKIFGTLPDGKTNHLHSKSK